ncbi:MAG: sialidase family protein [Nitrospiraceae bacterium]
MKLHRSQWTAMIGVLAMSLVPGAAFTEASQDSISLVLGPKQQIVEGPQHVSPPALQFDKGGALHVAWMEKQGETRAVRTVRVKDGGKATTSPVQVNRIGDEPDALHQSPGLAIGPNGELYLTWSTSKTAPGAFFATDLRLARSLNGGVSFEPPIVVNDDGNPITHSFEHVTVGPSGDVYLAWLDNRGKDKSGAGSIFTSSHDGGKTVGKNLTIDGMACVCCRPIIAVAPDASLWVSWRKEFEGNVRDIVVARSTDKGATFSAPILVNKDGWVFPACPHRGPSVAFDRFGRLYIGWYTEGTDEQPRLLFATSDDQGKTFSTPLSLHISTTSLPDQLRMAVHPDGAVVAVWEEVTGVRKRAVMRVSLDRGQSFGPVQALSEGAKAATPTVAIHEGGTVALSWTEHAWPSNRIVLQQGSLKLAKGQEQP